MHHDVTGVVVIKGSVHLNSHCIYLLFQKLQVGGVTCPTLEQVGGVTCLTLEQVGGVTCPSTEQVGGVTCLTL